jgi:hypothetical protein
MQPIVRDPHGTPRFKQNRLVMALVEAYPDRLSGLGRIPNIDPEDRRQLAQLIGYSLSGFGELSYVRDEDYAAAAALEEGGDPRDVRIAELEKRLADIREKFLDPMAELYGMHPADLEERIL